MTELGSTLVIMVRMSGVAMMSRGGSIMPVVGVTSVACQCARLWYLIWAVHGNMSIIISHSTMCEGNSMPYGQFLDIGNTCHYHWT